MTTVGTSFRVTVPASTANLGPGFDAFGLALALHDVVEFEVLASGLEIEVLDAGAGGTGQVPTDERHLVVRAVRRACEHLDVRLPGLRLRCHNAIPHSRGLGSSAAAAVAGVVAGYHLAGLEIDSEDVLQLAAGFEGHADNAAASLLGGFALAWSADGRFHAQRLTPDPRIRPVVAIAGHRSSTEATRGLLPDDVPHADAAFTASRAALAVHAMTSRPDLLLPATEDRLHQGYRASAYPATTELVTALRARGVPAAVSGAGPSVLALTEGGELPGDVDLAGFTVAELPVDLGGVRVS